jgi:hypothetical protein
LLRQADCRDEVRGFQFCDSAESSGYRARRPTSVSLHLDRDRRSSDFPCHPSVYDAGSNVNLSGGRLSFELGAGGCRSGSYAGRSFSFRTGEHSSTRCSSRLRVAPSRSTARLCGAVR